MVAVLLGVGAGSEIVRGQGPQTADFDDLPLDPESYWNGSDESGGFTSGSFTFNNNYNATWGSWSGWSYSNTTDATTPGYGNQYSAYAGSGAGGSANYGVSYNPARGSATVAVPPGRAIVSGRITNTTYTALSMLEGDAFAKRFGGSSGEDPDWLRLTIFGLDAGDREIGSVHLYLADYRFSNNNQDYVVDQWTDVDLSSLAGARTLEFELASSDVGPWGMNTPAYFALDDLTVSTPEPGSMVLVCFGAAALLLWRRRFGRA